MSTQRVMSGGSADLTGQRRGTLLIERMASRSPLRWHVRCENEQCNLQTVVDHARLQNGALKTCPNPQCGKTSPVRQSTGDVRQHIPLNRSNVSAEARRFYAEEAEREAKELREKNEREAAERAEQIDERNQIARANSRAYLRAQILSGPDHMLYVSPGLMHKSMATPEAQKFNGEQAARFIRETPEYESFRSDETMNAIFDYFARNGVHIFDVATLKAAFYRLRDTGVIQKRPIPKIEPEPAPKPAPLRVNLTVDGPELEQGWDENGRPLTLTKRQVDRLSATEYRKFKHLDRAALEDSLPKFGPGVVRPT